MKIWFPHRCGAPCPRALVNRLQVACRLILLLLGLVAEPAAAQQPTGSAMVAIFGDSHSVVDDNMGGVLAKETGVAVSCARLAIGGTQGGDLLNGFVDAKARFAGLIEQARILRPVVVMLAFGTNEAAGTSPGYRERYRRLLSETRRSFPGALIVSLGPPRGDRRKLPGLDTIRGIQAQEARAANVLWVDRAVLPGPDPGRDGIHYTATGYRAMAEVVASLLAPALKPTLAPGRR